MKPEEETHVRIATVAAGVARKAAPPKLKIAEEAPTEEPATIKPATEAAGIARRISKPTFKTAEEEPVFAPEPPVVETVKPAAEAAGVARSIAKPKMKVADEPAAPFSPVDDELITLFRDEASEYIQGLGVALGQLRAGDDDATWAEVRGNAVRAMNVARKIQWRQSANFMTIGIIDSIQLLCVECW